MNSDSNRKSLLIILSVASIVVSGTFLISIFARGYRLDTNNGNFKLKVTGLLSATSKPKSASVYINNLLVTATDDTINLAPGNYQIQISKDGYFSWRKNIKIKPELVYQTDAQLIRSSPELKPITQSKITNPTVSPDSTKIIYAAASTSATSKDNGLYLLELTELPLLMSKNSQKLLSMNLPYLDWTKFSFQFSPNSKQVLATSKTGLTAYLFSIDQAINSKNLIDISSRISQIKKDWQISQEQTIKSKLEKLPSTLQSLIATNSAVFSYNSSEDKVLYQASESATLPDFITPPPVQSTQPQQRSLQKDHYYVYDIKDDVNFLVGDTSFDRVSWIPYSNNLLYVQNKGIHIIEYDTTNNQIIYSGDFSPSVILPTPDGYRLIISIVTSKNAFENIYSVSIKDR
ncbi:MAG: PEGA domain-containing protein [Candidatus Shapirobacteria bacterium]